jgi:site-specific recombinase XerD
MPGMIDTTLFGLLHDFFKVYLPKQRHCSEHTIRAYRSSMDALLEFVKSEKQVELSQITFEMLDCGTLCAYLDNVEKNGCSVSTRNHRLKCIRSFFDYAAKFNPTTVIYLAEIQKVPRKNHVKSDVVDYMSEAAVKALIDQPDASARKGFRDRFFMLLLYDSAARVQEMLDIRLKDLKLGATPTVTLHGKGSKTRTVPMMRQTAEYYSQYVKVFHTNEPDYSEQHLFYSVIHGKKNPLNDSTIRRFLYAYGASARQRCPEVPEKVHPHLFRHSRAMHLYRHGMDLSLISQWLGHAQLDTTLIYAHADTEQKRRAIEKATELESPLNDVLNADRFTISDSDTIKKLYGLK